MIKRLLQILLLILIFYSISSAQIEYVSFGGKIGIGDIQGNSTPVTSAAAGFFVDAIPWFSDGSFSLRAGFLYAQKLEKLIPENRMGRYYPFIKSFSLNGNLRQPWTSTIFIEEGAGLIFLNDRTFGDVNTWEAGANFNALAGIDLRDMNSSGISLGLGMEYGITFAGTTASYYTIHAQIQYYP